MKAQATIYPGLCSCKITTMMQGVVSCECKRDEHFKSLPNPPKCSHLVAQLVEGSRTEMSLRGASKTTAQQDMIWPSTILLGESCVRHGCCSDIWRWTHRALKRVACQRLSGGSARQDDAEGSTHLTGFCLCDRLVCGNSRQTCVSKADVIARWPSKKCLMPRQSMEAATPGSFLSTGTAWRSW